MDKANVTYMNGDNTTVTDLEMMAPRISSQLWNGGRALVTGKDKDGSLLWAQHYTNAVKIHVTRSKEED